jgi:hypothetical protein
MTVRNGTYFALPAEIVRGLGAEQNQPAPPGGDVGDTDVPSADLMLHFGATTTPGAPRCVVYCGLQSPEQAILVDEVIGLTDVATEQVRPLPAQFIGPERMWFSGVFLFRDTVALVANGEWLLHQPVPPQSERRLLSEVEPMPSPVQSRSGSAVTQPAQEQTGEDTVNEMTLEEASDAEDNTPWAEL